MKTIELSKAIQNLNAFTEVNKKVAEVEKKVTTAIQAAEQAKADALDIPVDSMGHAKALSVDLAELPKVCGSPSVMRGTKVPDTAPDFIGQVYIDTAAKKVYQAVGVDNAGDFKVLN